MFQEIIHAIELEVSGSLTTRYLATIRAFREITINSSNQSLDSFRLLRVEVLSRGEIVKKHGYTEKLIPRGPVCDQSVCNG